ncbi:hypothetical protein EYF80_054657 [Liparis tanakae]|uniref:Uncharacterized protein n=1 Tax=Liparis tanakae TaxID=230148 RepID=A0A4Z2F1U0_9TELE|nr:hypothetical protein EYF80_054657 [Liparis tanakae]
MPSRLKESLALLEMEFTEFKEITQDRLNDSPDYTLQQLKRDNQLMASDPIGSLKELKQEKSALRAQ